MSENSQPIPRADREQLPPATPRPRRGRRRPGMLRTLARLSLGAGLLVVDDLIDRLEEDERQPIPSPAGPTQDGQPPPQPQVLTNS